MKTLFLLLAFTFCHSAFTQTADTTSVAALQTQTLMHEALKEAERLKLPVSVCILDAGGHLLAFQRMEGAPLSSIVLSQEKAKTACHFQLPSKQLEDWLNSGGQRMLTLPGYILIEGGIPFFRNGKCVGAIGVSGGSSQQDAQIAQKGISATSLGSK